MPGVAFPAAMDKLKKYDLIDPIHTAVRNGSKILGICLGMQLLFDISDEQKTSGLKLIKGKIKKMQVKKSPHIGWNNLIKINKNKIFKVY